MNRKVSSDLSSAPPSSFRTTTNRIITVRAKNSATSSSSSSASSNPSAASSLTVVVPRSSSTVRSVVSSVVVVPSATEVAARITAARAAKVAAASVAAASSSAAPTSTAASTSSSTSSTAAPSASSSLPKSPPRARKRRFQLTEESSGATATASTTQISTATAPASSPSSSLSSSVDASSQHITDVPVPPASKPDDTLMSVETSEESKQLQQTTAGTSTPSNTTADATADSSSSQPSAAKRTRWSSGATQTILSTGDANSSDLNTALVPASIGSTDAVQASSFAVPSNVTPPARRTRFQATTYDVSVLLQLHPTLPSGINIHQLCSGLDTNAADSLLTHLRIEAIQAQLHMIAAGHTMDQVDPIPMIASTTPGAPPTPARCRSPSPEPTYNSEGKRTNTRISRYKTKLVTEQKSIVDAALARNPTFRPPTNWKKTEAGKMKLTAKIPVPLDEYPDYNFKGCIIGVRGSTQQELEKRTGCKVAIRGKNSWSDTVPEIMRKKYDDDNEPQYVLIQAENEERLAMGVEEVKKLLIPQSEEERRKALQAIANANGCGDMCMTLRPCHTCGSTAHLQKNCPDRGRNFSGSNDPSAAGTSSNASGINCYLCGSHTHPTFDCSRARGLTHAEVLRQIELVRQNANHRNDAEYDAMMKDLFGQNSSSNVGLSSLRSHNDQKPLALMPTNHSYTSYIEERKDMTDNDIPMTHAEAHQRQVHQRQVLAKESFREYKGEQQHATTFTTANGGGWNTSHFGTIAPATYPTQQQQPQQHLGYPIEPPASSTSIIDIYSSLYAQPMIAPTVHHTTLVYPPPPGLN